MKPPYQGDEIANALFHIEQVSQAMERAEKRQIRDVDQALRDQAWDAIGKVYSALEDLDSHIAMDDLSYVSIQVH